jgi:hypothetical protein
MPHVQGHGSGKMQIHITIFVPTGHLLSDISSQFRPASGRTVLVRDDDEQTVEVWDF